MSEHAILARKDSRVALHSQTIVLIELRIAVVLQVADLSDVVHATVLLRYHVLLCDLGRV